MAARSMGRSLLLTLPIALWSLLMFSSSLLKPARSVRIAAVLTTIFMVTLFFLMMRTSSTYRWRRWFFVALGVLFPIGFVYNLMMGRGTMGLPIEEMIAGRTPFCFMPIPTLALPAALFKTIVFPGSILEKGNPPNGIAPMVGLWLALTLVIGKAWCSYACFFGGIEEGFASVPKRAKLRNIDPRWRYAPWAILLAMVLLSLALFEPAYCYWLCPFKAVTEYVAARNVVGMIQNGIFLVLFLCLVIVLPLLTRKRAQCAFFCPFGAFQSIFNKTSIFDVRIDRTRCADCLICRTECPTMSLTKESIEKGETLMSCMKCGRV
jgi:polyferredoxin